MVAHPGAAASIERLSVEVTQRCAKACAFCYSASGPAGGTTWSAGDLVAFVTDCARNGVRAISFGGGEPLEYPPLFEVLDALRGTVFRSVTTNGLPLRGAGIDLLVEAAPDKVHVSIHHPEDAREVGRVLDAVAALQGRGIRSGINLLVRRTSLDASHAAAERLRAAGIAPERIVFLPLRGMDTPTAADLARVAGGGPFQSMTCLARCAPSPRFCAVSWDRTVAWCSYTRERRPLAAPDWPALSAALDGLGLSPCGGTHGPR